LTNDELALEETEGFEDKLKRAKWEEEDLREEI